MNTKIYTILTISFLFIFACKPDCKRNIVLKQVACDCCDDEKHEILRQNFSSFDNKYAFQLELDGGALDFYMFKTYNFKFGISGHNGIDFSTVITPDSTYTTANKQEKYIQSCYYVPKVGIVKYSFDSTHHWLFLRNL